MDSKGYPPLSGGNNQAPYPTYGQDTSQNFNSNYPPVSSAYPPASNAYPPNSSVYPPASAPPPYTPNPTVYPPQETSGTTSTFVAINNQEATVYQPYTPEVAFNSKSVRLAFIRKVFGILSIQLLVTVGVICLFLFVPAVENAGRKLAVYIPAYVTFLVLYFVLVCCDSVRRSHPTNLILLSIFTLSLSYLVGVISSYHNTKIVLIMMGVTAIVTICVSLFACQTKFDMTKYGGVLCVCALVVFIVLIFSPAFIAMDVAVSRIAIGGVLALLFTAFMIYDVQLIMGGRKYELSEEEYVFGALVLYVDIINMLLILLYIFGGSNN